MQLGAGITSLALIVSISMALMVDKFGRRRTFLISTSGMFVTFLLWTLTAALYAEYDAKGSNYAMIVFIWVFNIMYAVAWSGLLVGYAIEILPYKLRAKGLMILNICIQAALALNNYANPVAFKAFGNNIWKLYLIYTVSRSVPPAALGHQLTLPPQGWIGLELIFVFYNYVETKGPTLEELAVIIDGDDAEFAQLDSHRFEKEVHVDDVHVEHIEGDLGGTRYIP